MAATKFGLTWWGQRWIGALEAMGARYANRLPRGRTYARNGNVVNLTIGAGTVTAKVTGSRSSPYRVTLTMPAFTDQQWSSITAALASQVRYAAALLDGRMPEDIDDVLGRCGLSLFPHGHELDTRCSCPDAVNPCKHVAAVHYELAQTFDADPFLLPELRGRDRAALLAGLRNDRVGSSGATSSSDGEAPGSTGTSLSDLSPGALFRARGDLGAIVVNPQPTEAPTATLRRLGPPPGEFAAGLDALTDVVEHAAERAWQLATGDDEHVDDPLLEELRALGSATSRELGDGLGWSVEVVRSRLSELVEQGLAHRTGHARSTRYHA